MTNEISARDRDVSGNENIVDLRHRRLARDDESLDPETLGDREVIEAFLSQVSHPTNASSSNRLAKVVYDHIGERPSQEMSDIQMAWRQRMVALMVDIEELDEDTLDGLLEDDSFRAIYDALAKTKGRAEELHDERRALLALRGLRATVINHNELQAQRSEHQWRQLIETLSRTALR